MKKAETLIQDEIIDYLNQNKILHWRISGSSNMSGFPDLLVCAFGQFVALEIKTPDGAPTEQQIKVMKDINDSYGIASIVTSVEEVKKAIWEAENQYYYEH